MKLICVPTQGFRSDLMCGLVIGRVAGTFRRILVLPSTRSKQSSQVFLNCFINRDEVTRSFRNVQRTIHLKIQRHVSNLTHICQCYKTESQNSTETCVCVKTTRSTYYWVRRYEREIFGATRTYDGYWRTKTNQEINEILK